VARHDDSFARAARALREADALLVLAGAGMGVDSGLPDFRGDTGFWKAYPPFAKLGLRFVDLASPRWFADDPELAWGFYGHRLNLYRETAPHRGFATLLSWARAKPAGAFVFTSNVDGHFQRAGFDPARIVECHGAIETSQCATPCGPALFPSAAAVAVDPERFRAARPLPACPRCDGLARPNVLMFGDGEWIGDRTDEQRARLAAWLGELTGARARLALIEVGAGTSVPTVRLTSEALARRTGATLVRINPREPEAPPGAIGLAMGALAALDALVNAAAV
jgi:NAD-dependent SIR2 family protein deacetylase